MPAWHSRDAWLGAAKLHPQLEHACRVRRVAVATFLDSLRALGMHADVATGRDIAVAHTTIGEQLRRCEKTIQRACRVAEDLGLLVRVLDGADMSLTQRITVLGHFSRGTNGAKWRSLPNFYAATMPRRVADVVASQRSTKPARGIDPARSVDNSCRSNSRLSRNVHLPVGSAAPVDRSVSLYSRRTTFEPHCAQPDLLELGRSRRTAAARPTTAHRRKSSERAARRLDPAVERFARDLRRDLLGFRGVSLYRICPGLSLYVSAGLSVSDLRRGLDGYLAAVGRTWLTSWRPDQAENQARYLIGMLNRARLAGYIPLPVDDDTGEWW